MLDSDRRTIRMLDNDRRTIRVLDNLYSVKGRQSIQVL